MSLVIAAQDLRKKFGEAEALRGVALSVQRGECVGLLGPNGAGKSTLISILYGFVQRTSGELQVFGLDPRTQARAIKRRVGVVPQENALDDALTVGENMMLFARFVGLSKAQGGARVAELLAYMNLDHKKDALIHELSGGMKRRLAFVRALLADPECLILDEPTTGLDPAVRHLLWAKVAELRRAQKTILVSTHYMHEAEALCDRVVVMNHGAIVANDTPRALIRTHAPGFVAIFTATPVLRGRLDSATTLTVTGRGDTLLVRAPAVDELVRLQREVGVEAQQMRPANLEDVFLKITGEELGENA